MTRLEMVPANQFGHHLEKLCTEQPADDDDDERTVFTAVKPVLCLAVDKLNPDDHLITTLFPYICILDSDMKYGWCKQDNKGYALEIFGNKFKTVTSWHRQVIAFKPNE